MTNHQALAHSQANGPLLRVLLGSGRSGTTWLLDVLCQANNLHPTFEPLHPAGLASARSFSRKYANAEHEWPELEAFVHNMQRGKYSKIWSDYRVRPDRLKPKLASFSNLNAVKKYSAHWLRLVKSRKVYRRESPATPSLIKLIRANLMASFLVTRLGAKMAFVVRHPAAVVESQLRLGVDWNAQAIAGLYSFDDRLEQRLGQPWQTLVKQTRSDAELFTLIWCLENLIPIEDSLNVGAKPGTTGFVFYEQLAQHNDIAWRQLLEALNLKNRPCELELYKPSQQASMTEQRKTIDQDQLAKSLNRLSVAQRDDIQRILDFFEVTMYHTGSALPASENVSVESQWSATRLLNRSS